MALVKEAEAMAANWTHPEPLLSPHAPGGTSWLRNAPPPFEICTPPELSCFHDKEPAGQPAGWGPPGTGKAGHGGGH